MLGEEEEFVATIRVEVRPELLTWACNRAGDGGAALRQKYTKLDEWIRGEAKPTLKQIEDFANTARVPVGYLFLPTPPVESLPIRDLRTLGGKGVRAPSPDLLDVIHLCQRRQDWYREYAEDQGEKPLPFVGSATITRPAVEVAAEMRKAIDFGTDARRECSSPTEALRLFIDKTEQAGILVMVSGVVKNSTNRPLDPDEFRGFALADPLAPLIFVNGADTKPAQMFTLAHELAHLWLGESAVSNASLRGGSDTSKTETWCNQVAAEFLVPIAELEAMQADDPIASLDNYRRVFQVSRMVLLRRLLDAGMIDRDKFNAAYVVASQAPTTSPRAPGGDFYNTLPVRASKRFVRALVASTLAGETLYRDAFQMLGISSVKTFRGIGQRVGGLT